VLRPAEDPCALGTSDALLVAKGLLRARERALEPKGCRAIVRANTTTPETRQTMLDNLNATPEAQTHHCDTVITHDALADETGAPVRTDDLGMNDNVQFQRDSGFRANIVMPMLWPIPVYTMYTGTPGPSNIVIVQAAGTPYRGIVLPPREGNEVGCIESESW